MGANVRREAGPHTQAAQRLWSCGGACAHELVPPRVEHFSRRPFPRDPAPAARARGQVRLKPPQIPGCDLVVDVGGEQRLDLAALGHAWHHAHFVI